MSPAALLLLQALALSCGWGLPHQDNDACAEGTQGACLAGAPHSVRTDDVQDEEAAFIQERASRSGSKRATGARSELDMQRLPGLSTDEDYLTSVGAINDTVNKIGKAVDLVNSTIAGVVTTVQSKCGTIASMLDLAKSGAEHIKIVIGAEAVASVETLVDKMAKTSDSFMAAVNETAGEVQDQLDKLWIELTSEEEELLEKITEADQQVQGAIKGNATLLQVQSGGVIDWLKHIFGLGRKKGPTPCEKAKESLTAANSSMQEFGSFIDRFNTSATHDLFKSLEAKLRSGLERFESAVKGILSGVGDSVPTSVMTIVREAIDSASSLVDTVKEKLSPVEKKIAQIFEEAKTPLKSTRDSLLSSGAKLATRCE